MRSDGNPSSRAEAPVATINVRHVYRSSEVTTVKGRVERSTSRHVAADDLGAETLGLRANLRHQLGPVDAVPVARPVLDEGGQHQLPARFEPLDDERLEVGARRIERRGQARRAGSDDDDVARRRHDRPGSVDQTCLSMSFFRASLSARPTTCSTSCPPLNNSRVGIPRMLKRIGVAGFSSTFIFATTTRPL